MKNFTIDDFKEMVDAIEDLALTKTAEITYEDVTTTRAEINYKGQIFKLVYKMQSKCVSINQDEYSWELWESKLSYMMEIATYLGSEGKWKW